MILLGFYLGHDSNIAVSINGKIKYRKAERHYEQKHHKADIKFIYETLKDWKITKVDYCCYTDGNRNNLGECSDLFCIGSLKDFKNYCIDHHYAHVLSLWPIIDIQKLDYGVVVDGRGDNNRSASVIKDPYDNPELIETMPYPSLGYEFYTLGQLYGFKGLEYDFAGKLMGLHAYSENEIYNQFKLPKFNEIKHKLPSECNSLKEWHNNWFKELKKLFKFDKNSYIGYTGGCAQNTVYNFELRKDYPNLFIPPHCYDGGLSLGCLEFLRIKFNQEPFVKDGFPYWQDDEIKDIPNDQTIKKVAKLLSQGKIIGWMQGKGELGPRALGNRSILMNATGINNKQILNKKVKGREAWRPYAGSILNEHALEYFDIKDSPYMLYACNVVTNKLPPITHIDKTCRIQTVTNGIYYNLINEYYNITNIPCILNTSLNYGGMPIASKESTAVNLFKETNMDALCIGNKIIEKCKFQ